MMRPYTHQIVATTVAVGPVGIGGQPTPGRGTTGNERPTTGADRDRAPAEAGEGLIGVSSDTWLTAGRRGRRRLALLVLLVLVVLIGAGIGTFVSEPPSADPGTPVVTVTPSEPTPAPPTDGPAVPTTPTATETSPTQTATPSNGSQTPTPTPTDTPGRPPTDDEDSSGDDRDDGDAGGSGGDSGSDSQVRLEAVGSTAVLNYDGVAPGQGSRDALRLRNAGTREARLSIENVTVSDDENGIVGPEAVVDDTSESGELSDHVLVAVEIQYPDGTVESSYETAGGGRSLAAIAAEPDPADGRTLGPGEEATVVFDWHVPAGTGNEIQSDRTEVAVRFGLRTT